MNTKSTHLLTLLEIQNTSGFPKGSVADTSYRGMVECKYKLLLQAGRSEQVALNETLDYIGEQMLKLS